MKHSARILLALALILLISASAWSFTDTAALNSAEQAALDKLSAMQVIDGYTDGSFRPAATVTRAEFSKMLCIYAGQTGLMSDTASFSDVLPGAWYYGWVNRVAAAGWINGYPGGEYRPQNSITQQEIATVLVRLSGANTVGFSWPEDYNTAAQNAGYFKDIAFQGGANASRIVACQMLFNALPGDVPQQTANVRGIVMEIGSDTVTIKDIKNISATYKVSGNLLPEKLIPGSYLEAEVADGSLVKVVENVLAKKGTNAYWDVALDGKSAIINDKKYDISEADIFISEYTLYKPYSADTFVKGGAIDRDILSLGGRLAAEMAVVLDESGSTLKAAYLVNASIVLTGGRLDVVEGGYSNAKGTGLYFLGREAGLPLADSLKSAALPSKGTFVHYTLRNGEISAISELFSADLATGLANVSSLANNSDDVPQLWVDGDGKTTTGPVGANSLPAVISLGSGRRTLQLGQINSVSGNFWLADGCLIYEIKNNEIKSGSRSSITENKPVIALVNKSFEICYLFCILD